MAYIVLTANHEEIDRVPLKGTTTIGRAADCEISVRDILMSRRHCRIEPVGRAWRLVDLRSRNGTRVGWQKISHTYLSDGDLLRVGRTWITFREGPFQPAPQGRVLQKKAVRPADPFEALAGTVSGFILEEPPSVAAADVSAASLEVFEAHRRPAAAVAGAAQPARPAAAVAATASTGLPAAAAGQWAMALAISASLLAGFAGGWLLSLTLVHP